MLDLESHPSKVKGAYIAGEALIDLISSNGEFTAHVGGGAANTAKALARLGYDSFFIGGISSDEYGSQILEELHKSGVNLTYVNQSHLPTALAKAVIDSKGVANYQFEIEGTATFSFNKDWLPKDQKEALHVGSLATLIEPGASSLFEWAKNIKACKIFDPNVRPVIQNDRERYGNSVEKWISIANVVKLSEEDLGWLYRDSEPIIVEKWLNSGVSLVIVTLGKEGLHAYTKEFSLEIPGSSIDLVDTVGAGDTVGAVLIEGILKHGLEGLLLKDVLSSVLRRAVLAAGINCSRAGANPPWASELG